MSSFTVPDSWVRRLTDEGTLCIPLIPSGGELHGFTIGAHEARLLTKARLIVGIHPQLEPWLADWAKANQRESVMVWLHPGALTSGSHLWVLPEKAASMTVILKNRLEKAGVNVSQDNYNQLLKEFKVVESELHVLFEKLGPQERSFISQHPGLEEFAEHFGLKIQGTILESPNAESADPSARHYAMLLKSIREHQVRVITVDEGQNHAFAERLATDAGLRPPVVLGFEFLQPAGNPGDTWAGMMRLNARKLATALTQP